jgi:hypothetical protein
LGLAARTGDHAEADFVVHARRSRASARSVLQEFPGFDAEDDAVRPGTYAFGSDAGSYRVTWWDPARLPLGAKLDLGVRRKELLGTEADWVVVDQDLEAHAAWRARRAAALEAGSRPSLTVVTVRAAAAESSKEVDVAVEIVAGSSVKERPRGPRFGSLVHAVLAAVPLGANRDEVAARADVNRRVWARAEIAAAGEVVRGPRLRCSCERVRQGLPLRRENAHHALRSDGRLIDGVLDLAFRRRAAGRSWTSRRAAVGSAPRRGQTSGRALRGRGRQGHGRAVRSFLLFV